MSMVNSCTKYPCGAHAGGCSDLYCPMKQTFSIQQLQQMQQPFQYLPAGCICPPTSEQTCESLSCPRQNPFKRGGASGTGHITESTK